MIKNKQFIIKIISVLLILIMALRPLNLNWQVRLH